MSGGDNRKAWADFWSTAASGGGCLPSGHAGIEAAQRSLWEEFARALPRKARVLDLATGDGAVLKMLARVRRDLALTGVDSAQSLPPAPSGIKLRSGVAIEELPFPDESFDAVTSQFGFEYGDLAGGAVEVARVLKPGGLILFIVHRSDGPIVAHNLPRRDALSWALAPGGWFGRALALATARTAAPLPTPPAFSTAAGEAQRLFPGQSAGGEFLQAVAQTLELGRRRPAPESVEVLRELEGRARNEIARIEALERAACDGPRISVVIDGLRRAGLEVDPPGTLAESSSKVPFAWLVSGRR